MQGLKDSHKTMYIKFPTVTKLVYPHETNHDNNRYRTTSYRSNLHNNIKFTLVSKTESFKIINLPSKNEIMNICTMNMNPKPQE